MVVSLKLNQLYCMDNAIEGHTGDGGEDGEKPRSAAFVSCHGTPFDVWCLLVFFVT